MVFRKPCRDSKLLNAISTRLWLQAVNAPQDEPSRGDAGRKTPFSPGETEADSVLLSFSSCRSENEQVTLFFVSTLDVIWHLQKKKTAVWAPNYGNLLYNDNPWSNLACTMSVVALVQMEILINSL